MMHSYAKKIFQKNQSPIPKLKDSVVIQLKQIIGVAIHKTKKYFFFALILNEKNIKKIPSPVSNLNLSPLSLKLS